jgi:Herpesviridae UL52/UL70 DNA primase
MQASRSNFYTRNAFSLWCHSHKVVLPKAAKSQECTHYTMDGFKMSIPWILYEEFLLEYGKAVLKDGCDLFMIEKKENLLRPNPALDSVYKMHFDFDFVQPDVVSFDFVCDMTVAFMQTIKSFYPDKLSLRGVLMQAPSKSCKGADRVTACIKTGFHLILDGLCVKRVEALTLRSACVATYRQKYGERCMPCNSVDDTIDSCVYMENGLRMMGSKKMVKCTACTKSKEPCFVCKGPRRMVAEDRAYMATHMITDTGDVTPIDNTDVLRVMKLCSIRSDLIECDIMVRPPGAPVSALAQPLPKSTQKIGDKRDMRYDGGEFRSDAVGLNKYPHEIESSTEAFKEIQSYVRKFHRVYVNIELVSIKSNADRSRYVCRTRGWGSSYCLNVGRDHTNNTIYFQMDAKKGLTQRCFSNKDCPPGCIKKCRVFESASVPIPEMLRLALFAPKPAAAEDKLLSRASSISDSTERAAAIHVAKLLMATSSSASSTAAETGVTPKSPQDLSKMTGKQVDSMSMLELAKAQHVYDGKSTIKAKRMRDEIVGGSSIAMSDAKKVKKAPAASV